MISKFHAICELALCPHSDTIDFNALDYRHIRHGQIARDSRCDLWTGLRTCVRGVPPLKLKLLVKSLLVLLSPIAQHTAGDVAAAAQNNDDFVALLDGATQSLLKATIIAKRHVHAARKLDHHALVVRKAPAPHRRNTIGKYHRSHVVALRVLVRLVCDSGAAQAGGL